MVIPPECPYCNNGTQLVSGDCVYPHRADLFSRKFYLCEPCKAWVGCHEGTEVALGVPANGALRKARQAAHKAFDQLWLSAFYSGRVSKNVARDEAYNFLAFTMGLPRKDCHIGMMTIEQCNRVVAEINKRPK